MFVIIHKLHNLRTNHIQILLMHQRELLFHACWERIVIRIHTGNDFVTARRYSTL